MTLQNFEKTIQYIREIAKKYYDLSKKYMDDDEEFELFSNYQRLNSRADQLELDKDILFQ